MPNRPRRWSVTILTIPSRAEYLRRLLQSLTTVDFPADAEVVVVSNRRSEEPLHDMEARIRGYAPGLDIAVFDNRHDATIAGGRNFQLNVCKAPLVCFLDDDVTVHGEIFGPLEQALRSRPLGLVGLPSQTGDTGRPFKPREGTPSVTIEPYRFMTVQGMLVAGYRDLLQEVGGFNPRRRFWGEWTELNLRLWRSGFPTGYRMDAGHTRHWEEAPESPTRNMDGREAHVVWGLICTALEYDAVDATEATETFWQLVEDRYLAYSFGDRLSPSQLLRTTLELMPRLSAEWGQLTQFREAVRNHPFPFKPFHRLTEPEVREVLASADHEILPYRQRAFGSGPAPRRRRPGVVSRFFGRLLPRR